MISRFFTLGIPHDDFEISESSVDSSVRQCAKSIIYFPKMVVLIV